MPLDGPPDYGIFRANAVTLSTLDVASGNQAFGVYGDTQGSFSYGLYGSAIGASSYGVYGISSQYIAIRGDGGTRGVHGSSSSAGGIGVSGAVSGSGAKAIYGVVSPSGVGYAVFGDNPSTATGAWAGYFSGKLKVTGQAVCPSCTDGHWSTAESDIRLKTDVKPIEDGLDRVMRLRAVSFRWKDPGAHGGEAGLQRGFIAQEVEKVLPEWVGVDEKGIKTVNYNGIDALLVESVQRLKAENDALRDRVRKLEPVTTAGLNPNGPLGLGLAILGGAIIVSRRHAPDTNV